MISVELCEHPTPSGPCNMPRGHNANFHRHRVYPQALTWKIEYDTEVIQGRGRVELGAAITQALTKSDNLVITLKRNT